MDKRPMKKSGLYLFKLAGFEVRLDFSWIFLAILITWTLAAGYFPFHYADLSETTYWVMGVIGTLGLFISVILHELCHSLMGRHYGIPISGIKLFIFGGIAEMSDTPPDPKAEFLMAIVGPLFSILFGFALYFLLQVLTLEVISTPIYGIIEYLSLINIILGIFNMLPGFPLDGGRVFRSILWWWTGNFKWATEIACKGGAVIGLTMVLFGILQFIFGAFIAGIWLFLLGLFIQYISRMSYQDVLIKTMLSQNTVKQYCRADPVSVSSDLSIKDLVEKYFFQSFHKLYPVIENDQLTGYITLNSIKNVDKEKWSSLTVKSVMNEDTSDICINSDTKVTDVLKTMSTQTINRMIVMENDKLYGIITLKDLMDMIAVRMNLNGNDNI